MSASLNVWKSLKPSTTLPTASSAACARPSSSHTDSNAEAPDLMRFPALIMCWNSWATVPRVRCRTVAVGGQRVRREQIEDFRLIAFGARVCSRRRKQVAGEKEPSDEAGLDRIG